LKLGKPGSKQTPIISEKEKALFVLEANAKAIDEKITDI